MENLLQSCLRGFIRMDRVEKTAACLVLIAILCVAGILLYNAVLAIMAYSRARSYRKSFAKKINTFKPDPDEKDFKDGFSSCAFIFFIAVVILVLTNNM